MTPHEMTIQIARAEGVMTALYGICRDMVIGRSVDENKDGKLGDVMGDCMNGLMQVYNELEPEEAGQSITTEQAISKIIGEICEHGQHDKQFRLGDIIKYSPGEIEKILKEAVDNESK